MSNTATASATPAPFDIPLGEEWRFYGTQADPRCRFGLRTGSGATYPCANDRGSCTGHAAKPIPADWPMPRGL